jgi:CRP/FNR family transcriptional regulator, cyclic AMP receptor protein
MAKLQTAAIAKSPIFAELSQRDLRHVAKAAEVYTFTDGQPVVREGASTDGFFVILDGGAKVIRGGRTIRRLQSGDFFGEIGLLDGGPRTATVVADGPLSALVLLRKEFRNVVSEEPEVGYQILRGAARRLRSFEAS